MRLRAALALAASLMAACDGPRDATPTGTGPTAATITSAAAPPDDDAARHERGRKVYNFRCYFCHGYSGDAKTQAAAYLTPAPRDFIAPAATGARALDRTSIARVLRDGRPGTAMASFANVIDAAAIDDVAAFVEREFVVARAPNTRYHTADNGWPDHERHRAAFAFATGELAIDTPDDALGPLQRHARTLFLGSCVTCHDGRRTDTDRAAWAARPVSYPRGGFTPADAATPAPVVADATSSASLYARHDVAPAIGGLTPKEQRGAKLFVDNCAFCHGASGTGRNWIGQFMEPKARDLTAFTPATMPPARLRRVIREGLPGTSMPAWQHVLAARDIDALAAYVQRAFVAKAPAGRSSKDSRSRVSASRNREAHAAGRDHDVVPTSPRHR